MSWKRGRDRAPKPWHIVGYEKCSWCPWSPGVRRDGKVTRHSVGFGYVEKFPDGSKMRTMICPGSNKPASFLWPKDIYTIDEAREFEAKL